ncbi:uncharacterized protein LOC130987699 isoform X2 [Salvia miltiorrhiza]|uniref:uncharacterized protein LOC130987699 isoform X2 n=1 Tax=Salvia miltiorrhiza TaxID=226208 RepID=UPI0025AC8C7B|nr:uncharacterized protein LOC130987699 isoform X2 [Salvia miltiorrhiza]XP_057767303.1 uncharacterized protein LOC130987699 isoform X2 [Salvia miltiorrhiza]
MEEQKAKRKRGIAMKSKKKKKKRNLCNDETVFPLLLASFSSKPHVEKALIKKYLNKIFLSLPHLHLPPILALLPSLLKSDCAEIVCKSADIVGAASLAFLEMSELIAAEDEIVRRMIALVGNSEREIAIAACNAVLDLSAGSVGRQRLLEFGAIEIFILRLMQGIKPPAATVGIAADTTLLKEDEHSILLLQGATTLINSASLEQLQLIPTDTCETLLVHLRGLLRQVHKQRLFSTSSTCDQGNELYASNIRVYNLVESVFRLSINYGLPPESVDLEHVKKGIFGLGKASIESFLSEVWEASPMLIRNSSKDSLRQDGIFNPFLQYHHLKEAIPSVLPSMLKCFTSCPAIASDELDILRVIEDIKNHLGYQIIYNQDIRVVKTQFGEREVHYFQEQTESCCSISPHILSINDILECEEAFKKGYSIALRGMEFRCQTIAVIADELASLFGQPSAGVNMYLTPSDSQGLARHSDDHCVFVCQLIGAKRWKIYPRPDSQLPRLYEPCSSLHDLEDGSHEGHGHQQIVLKEGDILYIPRGFPHEAITDVDDHENANTAKFSLHMTLAIEIEPPFEWEGFMQVALCSWDKKQRTLQYKSEDSVKWSLHLLSVRLLCIAIKLIRNLDPVFQKACLVGAMPFHSETTREWLHKDQTKTFGYLISRIISESRFSDAVSHLEATLQKNEDPFEHLRWMKYLTLEGEGTESSSDLSIPSADSRVSGRRTTLQNAA